MSRPIIIWNNRDTVITKATFKGAFAAYGHRGCKFHIAPDGEDFIAYVRHTTSYLICSSSPMFTVGCAGDGDQIINGRPHITIY